MAAAALALVQLRRHPYASVYKESNKMINPGYKKKAASLCVLQTTVSSC